MMQMRQTNNKSTAFQRDVYKEINQNTFEVNAKLLQPVLTGQNSKTTIQQLQKKAQMQLLRASHESNYS